MLYDCVKLIILKLFLKNLCRSSCSSYCLFMLSSFSKYSCSLSFKLSWAIETMSSSIISLGLDEDWDEDVEDLELVRSLRSRSELSLFSSSLSFPPSNSCDILRSQLCC